MIFRSLLAFALTMGGLFAQVECDDGLGHIPTDVQSFGGGRCGSTAVTVSAVRISAGGAACPRMVLVSPAHSARIAAPGSNLRAVLNGVLPGLVFTYECRTTRLIWLLPLYSECVGTGSHASGAFNHFTLVACP